MAPFSQELEPPPNPGRFKMHLNEDVRREVAGGIFQQYGVGARPQTNGANQQQRQHARRCHKARTRHAGLGLVEAACACSLGFVEDLKSLYDLFKRLFGFRVLVMEAIPEIAAKLSGCYGIAPATEIQKGPVIRNCRIDNIKALKLHQDRRAIGVSLNRDHCWTAFWLETNTKSNVCLP